MIIYIKTHTHVEGTKKHECISFLISFDPCADLPYRVLVARFIEIIARKCSEPSVRSVLIGRVPRECWEFGFSLPAMHFKKYFVNLTHCACTNIWKSETRILPASVVLLFA